LAPEVVGASCSAVHCVVHMTSRLGGNGCAGTQSLRSARCPAPVLPSAKRCVGSEEWNRLPPRPFTMNSGRRHIESPRSPASPGDTGTGGAILAAADQLADAMKMATQALQRRRVSVSPVGAANCKAGSQRRSRSVGEPPAPKQTTAPMRRTSSRYSELQATSLTNAGMRQVAEQCSELTGMLKEKAAKVARSTTGTKNSARNDDAVSVCEVWGKAFKT